MAWTNLLNSLFLVGKPITSAQGLALRDNPLAIAEGSAGAPRVQGVALGNVVPFFGAVTTTPIAFTGLDRIKTLIIDLSVATPGSGALSGVSIEFSTNNGASWSTAVNMVTVSGPGTSASVLARAYFDLETLDTMTTVFNGSGTLGTYTIPANVNAFRIARGASGTATAAVSILGGYA